MGFLSKSRSGKEPQLMMRGEFPGCSLVAAEFLSSYNGKLRDTLGRLREVQSPLESRGASRDSSAVGARC